MNIKEPSKAIVIFKKIIQIEPDAAYAYNELGTRYDSFGLNIPDSASYYYRKAVELSPTWQNALLKIGNFYVERTDFEKAITYYNMILKIDSLGYGAYNNLFNVYQKLNKKGKADSLINSGIILNKAELEKNSSSLYLLINLGRLYQMLGDHQNTIKYLEEALKLQTQNKNPNTFFMTNFFLIQEYGALNNYNEVIKLWKELINFDPRNPSPYSGIAGVYWLIKNYKDAIINYKKAVTIAIKQEPYFHEEQSNIYTNLGRIYLKLNNKKLAELYFDKAIKATPNADPTYSYIAYSYYDIKDYNNYIKIELKAIRVNPSNPVNFYNIACGYSLKNETKNSIANLKIAFEKGYKDFGNINNDIDLNNLRQLPEFKELMKQYFPEKVK